MGVLYLLPPPPLLGHRPPWLSTGGSPDSLQDHRSGNIRPGLGTGCSHTSSTSLTSAALLCSLPSSLLPWLPLLPSSSSRACRIMNCSESSSSSWPQHRSQTGHTAGQTTGQRSETGQRAETGQRSETGQRAETGQRSETGHTMAHYWPGGRGLPDKTKGAAASEESARC